MNQTNKEDANTNTLIIPPDYLKLFADTNGLTLNKTIVSRSRSAISLFDYDKKFSICVYKIDSLNKTPLNSLVEETYVDRDMSNGLPYHFANDDDHYEILYKSGFPEKISGIYLNLFGNKTLTIEKNDSIAYYYSKSDNFYIKYNLNGPDDFFGRVKSQFEGVKIPIEIMFRRHKNNLYLILLTRNDGLDILPGTLSKLLR
ncbi:MAG: hypothetical protein ACTHJ8_13755 [Mucilaginibacter sp.]